MASITSANSSFFLAIAGLYVTAQKIVGYSTDDAFTAESVTIKETMMGIDGTLSAGFINAEYPMTITLQADSTSGLMFDAWAAAEKAAQDVYFASGIITYPSVSMTYVLTRGVLKAYKPLSDAKKVLQARQFGVTWESIFGAPI
jgi:hypothetical protein